ncbi:MAG: hypothetical protein HY695_34540 [Deltaproteobacteria bacterium]|nr:hypothetical protein [Deltaproteobacteria bacterium]
MNCIVIMKGKHVSGDMSAIVFKTLKQAKRIVVTTVGFTILLIGIACFYCQVRLWW